MDKNNDFYLITVKVRYKFQETVSMLSGVIPDISQCKSARFEEKNSG